MNKFNKRVILFLILLSFFSLEAAKKSGAEILQERLENEKKDVSYRLKVVSEEEHAILLRILNLKMQMMKLRVLTKSGVWLKKQCPPFQSYCSIGYGMSTIYFKKYQQDISHDIANTEEQLQEIEAEKATLTKRVADLKKGFVSAGKKKKQFRVKIPELNGLFSCSKVRGWNPYRGVFIDKTDEISLPLSTVVDSVVEQNGTKMLTLDSGRFFISFAYVDKVFVKAGAQVAAGAKLFSGAKGNPLKEGTVLMFIAKKDTFIYPTFVCK
ncbi:hypothetical protein KAH37_06015 [bacterium]|nr:hypothetical protein [bacterium]